MKQKALKIRAWHLLAFAGIVFACSRSRRTPDTVGYSLLDDHIGARQSFGINTAIDSGVRAAKARATAANKKKAATEAARKKVADLVRSQTKAALGPKKKPSQPLYIFVHDAAVIPTAIKAVKRIEAASGIKIYVNARGTIATAHPIYGSDFLCANGTDGRMSSYGIALARNCKANPEKVLIHELIHLLGVPHLELPARGIMNEATDKPLDTISAADLTALCKVRSDCTKFIPEA